MLRAQQFTSLHQIDQGFHVVTQGSQPGFRIRTLPDSMGLVIGSLYCRPDDPSSMAPCPPLDINEDQAIRILESQGRWLVDHAWGSYVAFLNHPGRRPHVVTSPGGDLPCHLTRQHGVSIVFSDIQPLLHIESLRFSINDHYLQSKLALGGLTEHSPLTEIRPVGRGEHCSLDADFKASRHFHWHPLQFIADDQRIEDVSHAAACLRATVHACTHTLIAPHDSSLLRLSGGLDSSIIAGCLQSRPQPRALTCHTFCSWKGRSQEQRWAESVVQRHDLPHRELPVEASGISFQDMMHMRRLIEPTPTLYYIMRSKLEQPLVDELQATAVFTGDGGDSGFCGESYAYALTDYLQHHGIRPRAWALASQIAALTQQSTWTVLRRSLHRWRHGVGMEQHRRLMAPTLKLINPALLQTTMAQARFPHPWFNQTDTVPWPLIRRLGMLISLPQPYDVAAAERTPEVIAPLYAQPVMELLLRIPSYIHFLSGQERGLARHAFSQDLPPDIAQRRWKDRPASFLDGLVAGHRKFLQELFLDGELVRRNLLDRAAVADSLDDRTSRSTVQPVEALRYLDYEFWLRAWRN